MSVQEAYAEVGRITRREAKNFAYGIMLLPKPKRQAIAAVYAFARRVDDVADGDLPLEEKRARLEDLRAALEVDDRADPVFVALRDARDRFGIPHEPFEALIDLQGRYALENYLISYVTTGRDLLRSATPRAPRSSAVIIAGPDYGPFAEGPPAQPPQPIGTMTFADTPAGGWQVAPRLEAQDRDGVIAGVVTDENGEPLQGVAVQALVRRSIGGRRRLTPASSQRLSVRADLPSYRWRSAFEPTNRLMGLEGMAAPVRVSP